MASSDWQAQGVRLDLGITNAIFKPAKAHTYVKPVSAHISEQLYFDVSPNDHRKTMAHDIYILHILLYSI